MLQKKFSNMRIYSRAHALYMYYYFTFLFTFYFVERSGRVTEGFVTLTQGLSIVGLDTIKADFKKLIYCLYHYTNFTSTGKSSLFIKDYQSFAVLPNLRITLVNGFEGFGKGSKGLTNGSI